MFTRDMHEKNSLKQLLSSLSAQPKIDGLDPASIPGQFGAGVETAYYTLHGLTLESPSFYRLLSVLLCICPKEH